MSALGRKLTLVDATVILDELPVFYPPVTTECLLFRLAATDRGHPDCKGRSAIGRIDEALPKAFCLARACLPRIGKTLLAHRRAEWRAALISAASATLLRLGGTKSQWLFFRAASERH